MTTVTAPVPSDSIAEPWATEQTITCRDDRVGLRAVIAIDDTTLGPGFGGVRFRAYPSTEAAAREAQRLAAAMTLKHALAELPYGGAKSVVMLERPVPAPGSPERRALFARFGEMIARTAGYYVPGVDMGTLLEDMQTIRDDGGARAFCDEVSPSPFTARGVYAAMKAAAVHHHGEGGLADLHVVVQGVGSVGAEVARLARADGARLTVADVDSARAQELADELGGATVAADEAPFHDADVFAPCAIARVVTRDNIARVPARIIAGAANDTLDEPGCAEALREAGITFVPDFVANAGGVIQVHGGVVGWSDQETLAAVDRIGERVTGLLVTAQEQGITPLAAALQRASAALGREVSA
ncbi:leucine dehydrogenase [Janibacter sp. Soil728]|uniref:Glu/Leu/Phe/Val dehydrogenase dimerization domain-containing protein n=1 Tax=Janibacter sp. Soil728 TaxID=1736393 RepID=UPI0006FAF93D|nr:Glu/Leu/Phe/Val dehydrogenase dimerization domain-containing protein [Janibacter sp. Soil728]KRE35804.1 leucine dehydrogenase [Janibacter sp. Soil728]